jgi:hypothetical protein
LISHNVLTNNGAAGVIVFQSAHVDVFSNASINNNLNVKEGEILAGRSSDVNISSNIMIARSGSYATGGYSDTHVTYDHNFVAGPATFGATPHGPHDILADPHTVRESYANGVLTVSDGAHSATLNFQGSYVLANFKLAGDPPLPGAGAGFSAHSTVGYSTNSHDAGWTVTMNDGSAQRLALLGQYAAASFVSGGAGDRLITHSPELVAQAQLVKPHG